MNVLHDPTPETSGERTLLAMLPGVNDQAESFFRHGVVRALRDRGLPIDVLAVDAHFPVYADQTLVDKLEAEIARVSRERNIGALWFLGTSLGGMGALMYSRARPDCVDGVILLAPYLGSRRIIAEARDAGGLSAWQPRHDEPGDMEWRVLDWLRRHVAVPTHAPRIYLGYAREDPFAPASAMLEQQLPAERTAVVDGGHDWTAWAALWQRILAREPFSGRESASFDL